ncbi:MAG: hypothetical protein [Bacteriophage sp.]|nr:MAG: hypothetical protein [Bacteriophage sp.]
MNEIETLIREARLPIRFNSFKELYEGFSHEVREALDLEFGRKDSNTVGTNIFDSLKEIMDSQGIITLVNNTYKKIFTDIYNDNYKLFQDKGLFIKRMVVKE